MIMNMNKPAAYGLYSHDVALREVIGVLNQAGFGNEDMCVMLSPTHPIATSVREARILNAECGSIAVTAGLIGWLSKLGAVLIPTIGFYVRSRAFLHALMVGMDSPTLRAASRTLEALGFKEGEAQRFENQLHQCGVLIYLSCGESAQTHWAIELLRRTGADEVATLERELSSFDPEPRDALNSPQGYCSAQVPDIPGIV
jgi:hypothetical protein